jgi:hypothetical protein
MELKEMITKKGMRKARKKVVELKSTVTMKGTTETMKKATIQRDDH